MNKVKNEALSWAKKCAKSNGAQVLLTGDDKEAAKIFMKKIEEFDAKQKAFSRETNLFRLEVDEFWVAIKKSLSKSGVENALEYDLDLDNDAKKEGYFVVNLTKPIPKNRF